MTKFSIEKKNHLNINDSYQIRLFDYSMMALLSSVILEKSGGRTIEYIDFCHPNLRMYTVITSTISVYECSFVRKWSEKDSQLKSDYRAEHGLMYMLEV